MDTTKFTQYGSSYYYFVSGSSNNQDFSGAESGCAALNAHLPSFKTPTEWDAIVNFTGGCE